MSAVSLTWFCASFPDSRDISSVLREHTNGPALMCASFHSQAWANSLLLIEMNSRERSINLWPLSAVNWTILFGSGGREKNTSDLLVSWSQYAGSVSVEGFVWILGAPSKPGAAGSAPSQVQCWEEPAQWEGGQHHPSHCCAFNEQVLICNLLALLK